MQGLNVAAVRKAPDHMSRGIENVDVSAKPYAPLFQEKSIDADAHPSLRPIVEHSLNPLFVDGLLFEIRAYLRQYRVLHLPGDGVLYPVGAEEQDDACVDEDFRQHKGEGRDERVGEGEFPSQREVKKSPRAFRFRMLGHTPPHKEAFCTFPQVFLI